MTSEDEFFKNAIAFFEEIGVDTEAVSPDTDLIDTGILDSLAILTFLDFLEQQWDSEIDFDDLDTRSISTLERAHRFMTGER